MFGIFNITGQEFIDQLGSLIGGIILQECLALLGRGQQAYDVEIGAAEKRIVIQRLKRSHCLLGQLGIQDAVDRIGAACDGRRKLGTARQKWGLVDLLSEGEARFPRQGRIDPALQQGDLLVTKGIAFGRHAGELVVGAHAGEQFALPAVFRDDLLSL